MNRCIECGRLIGKKEHTCKPAWNKGKRGCYKLSEETKAKIGNSLRGKHYHSEEFKDKLADRNRISKHNVGRKHTPETIEKMKLNNKRANLGKPAWNKGIFGLNKRSIEWREKYSGKNSSNWRGGISGLNARIRVIPCYKEWRFNVFKRDNFCCVLCESKIKINADHINAFSLLLKENNIKSIRQAEECISLWDISNGRTLCYECHKKTDNFAGKVNKRLDPDKQL